ncbi:MAG: glycosyltransferase [Gammaproteobacteria bacterium]|nr:MAG: glycosyltransferase [Gammaproteobacteria bacterium]
MSNHNIKLSIIIPSFNYADYIDVAIKSVIDQTMSAHEIIVVDDGSTDHTSTVVEALQGKYSNSNICYFYQDNQGVSTARNYGYKRSSGDYLLFLDADDKLLPGTLKVVYEEISNRSEIDMIFGGYQAVSYSGELRLRTPVKLVESNLENVITLLNGKMVGLRPSSSVLKRCVLDKIKFPLKVHVDEDTMFFSHVMYHYKCVSIPDILVEMPRHTDSLRENYQRIIETGVHGVEELFASLPSSNELLKLKKHVLVKRYLKVGRISCINKDYKIASQNYLNAAKLEPRAVLNLKHFPRLMKSLVLR